jgi:hypothetical protein
MAETQTILQAVIVILRRFLRHVYETVRCRFRMHGQGEPMKPTLLWIAAFLFAGLAWFVAQSRAEYRWAHQKIPMKHLNG